MPSYKVTYFNAKGRAELARLVFATGGLDFTDERLSHEEWATRKPDAPLGQMPLLTVDGEVYPQSVAIARFAAAETGLQGTNDFERFQADVIVDTCSDLINSMVKVYFEKDETLKENLKKTAIEETGPKIFSVLEGYLESFGNKTGFFLPSGLSWADLAVMESIDKWLMVDPNCLDGHAKLAEHSKMIKEVPAVAEWLEKRPVTSR